MVVFSLESNCTFTLDDGDGESSIPKFVARFATHDLAMPVTSTANHWPTCVAEKVPCTGPLVGAVLKVTVVAFQGLVTWDTSKVPLFLSKFTQRNRVAWLTSEARAPAGNPETSKATNVLAVATPEPITLRLTARP